MTGIYTFMYLNVIYEPNTLKNLKVVKYKRKLIIRNEIHTNIYTNILKF